MNLDRLKAMWSRLGKPEQIAIGIGIPLVALAAIVASVRRKPEPEPEEAAAPPAGTPQQFGPSPFDITRYIDEVLDKTKTKVDDVIKTIPDPPLPPATPTPTAPTAPSPAVLAQMSHRDLITQADAVAVASPGQVGPYLDEIHRRFTTGHVGPDGAISVNGDYWKGPDGKPRAIWYMAGPGILAILKPQW